jgi:hypothetical protein
MAGRAVAWRLALVVGLACGLAAAGQATAATSPSSSPSGRILLDTLKTFCVETDARHDAVIAATEAQGFVRFDPGDSTDSPLVHADVRLRAADKVIVAAGDMPSPRKIKGYLLETCLVATDAAITAPLAAAVRRWLGLTPFERLESGAELFFFDEGPSGRRSLEGAADADLQDLARQGRVRFVAIPRAGTTATLLYGVMRPDAAAPPVAAQATTPFSDFTSLCAAHRGQPDESLKAADQAGWMEVAPAMRAKQPPYPFVDAAYRVKSTTEDLEVVAAGRGRMQVNLQILNFTLCGVMQAPPADQALLTAVNDWVGLEPVDTFPDGSRIYLFVEEAGRRRSLAGRGLETALARGFKTGAISVVITQQGSSTSSDAVAAYGVVTQVRAVSAAPTAYAAR